MKDLFAGCSNRSLVEDLIQISRGQSRWCPLREPWKQLHNMSQVYEGGRSYEENVQVQGNCLNIFKCDLASVNTQPGRCLQICDRYSVFISNTFGWLNNSIDSICGSSSTNKISLLDTRVTRYTPQEPHASTFQPSVLFIPCFSLH